MPPTRLRFAWLLILLTCPAQGSGPSGEPGTYMPFHNHNWTSTSQDGRFIFVMREPNPVTIPEGARKIDDSLLALEYPQSGLYRTQNRQLLWSTDVKLLRFHGFQHHNIRVLNDGIHVIWFFYTPQSPWPGFEDGTSWWNTTQHTCTGPSAEPYSSLRAKTNIQFMTAGKLVASYRPDQIINDETRVLKSMPFGYSWLVRAETTETELILETLDYQKVTFRLDTGELTGRENIVPIDWNAIALVTGLFCLLSLGVFALYRWAAFTSVDNSTRPQGNH